jgi:FkbM family methyltransferase
VQGLISERVKGGDVVYDIGAHVGFFTMLLSRHAGDGGRVVAFEPIAENVERLHAAIDANEAANVEVRGVAISDRAGEERLALYGSSLEGELAGDGPLHPACVGTIDVRTVTLDDVLSGGAPVPTLLKIDVEGAEGRVLRGGRNLLTAHRPALLIEIHSTRAGAEVCDALPIAYAFRDVLTGRPASLPLTSGHYYGTAAGS